jgi:hypothetical protein
MRFILSLGATAVLFGAMSSPLMAAGKGGHGGGGHGSGHGSVGHGGLHASVGHSAAIHVGIGHGVLHGFHYGPGGYYGRDFRGWRGSYWNVTYGCSWYFCPDANCYYYWYAPWDCYLPVSQIALYPPPPGSIAPM